MDFEWSIPRQRGVFCNRTLNLRTIKAIGYDMDYTLVHYKVHAWEGRAYDHIKQVLLEKNWPVANLQFDPKCAIRGLIIDTHLGNIVKANRFGYVKLAAHGTTSLDYETVRDIYSRIIVDLADPRYVFLNTLFSISGACIFAQLVDLLDAGKLPKAVGYCDLYALIFEILHQAHIEGELKAEIMANPDNYVKLDAELPLTLLDQYHAGKKLLLITNSEWDYAMFMMAYAFDRFLPAGMTWRDLFTIIVVSARKPSFFSSDAPMFRVVGSDGMLKPCIGILTTGGTYFGGNAAVIEKFLNLAGEQILYVGDHIFADVRVSKSVLRWRTALIIRELEKEIRENEKNLGTNEHIGQLMQQKQQWEAEYNLYKLQLQRQDLDYGEKTDETPVTIRRQMQTIREKLEILDGKIAPLLVTNAQRFHSIWGSLMRTGNDKSRLTRQIEQYADIYTSRVSNLFRYTPFTYFRSLRGSLSHDPLPGETKL